MLFHSIKITSSFRDILNHSYFDKRSLYLAGIAKSLTDLNKTHMEHDKHYTVSVGTFKGDSRKPILIVSPTFNSYGVSVRIIPVVSAHSCFELMIRMLSLSISHKL